MSVANSFSPQLGRKHTDQLYQLKSVHIIETSETTNGNVKAELRSALMILSPQGRTL